MKDTIFALSTLAGKSGVAIVRISGGMALKAIEEISSISAPKPRLANYVELTDPKTSENIDQAIVIYFKGPNSFTGEDVVEIQFHGSIAVIDHLLEVLSNMPYLRLAEPGEFSKRAFFNEKLDLTQAEGLADLIDAETRLQKKVALRQLGGQLRNLYESWRASILDNLAKIEALIDFPEDDIPQTILSEINHSIESLGAEIDKHISANNTGEIINRGMNIAIVGAPNVGKSSLLNSLAKNDIAIVSDIAGTTRDVISVKIDVMGYPVIVSDTAGIRETDDAIEIEGVKRSMQTLAKSDIQIIMLDASSDFIADLKNNLQHHISLEKPIFVLLNKADLNSKSNTDSISEILPNSTVIELSVKTGYAMQDFLDELTKFIRDNYSISNEPLITHHRYRLNLRCCLESIGNYKDAATIEISAEYIRQAALEIGKITGLVDVEEILDKIFSSFCIGK